ncbi:MAG: aromatic aminobenezylarsenical efflux permease ArsG family transporter [Muribaculaceae bacterium]
METIQALLDNGTTPALTALLLGLLTAISPCPLATNIAAIGFISKDITDRRAIFRRGLLYSAGRVVAYWGLAIVLILLINSSVNIFGLRSSITVFGEAAIGPLLLVIGLFMLFGHKLSLPKVSFSGEGLARRGNVGAMLLGMLFALAFCPTSGVFYFGMLIPLSASTTAGWLLPPLFAVATALPVVIVAWVLAFSVGKIGTVYGRLQAMQRWLNTIVAALFILLGIYYCITIFIL